MKKLIKATCMVLALIMTALTFTGCSDAETGLLYMIQKAVSTSENLLVDEEVTIDLHDDLAASIYAEFLTDKVSPEDYPDKLTVTLKGKQNIKEMLADLDVAVSIGELASVSFKYILEDKTVYIGNFAAQYDKEAFDLDAFSSESLFLTMNAASVYEGVDYLYISPYESLYDTVPAEDGEDADETVLILEQFMTLIYDNMEELYSISFNALKNMFKGYTTGAVTAIENGYRISADIEDMTDMLVGAAEYIISNPAELFEGCAVFYEELAELAAENGKEEAKEMFIALAEEMGAIDVSEADTIPEEEKDTVIKALFDDEAVAQMQSKLKGTEFELEMTEKDGVMNENIKLDIVVDGIIAGTVEAKSSIAPCDPFEAPEIDEDACVSLIEMYEYLATYPEFAENVAIAEMRITWDGTEGVSEVYGILFDDISGEEYAIGLYDFYNIDGSMYLPMRRICERFGEVVEWDAVNGKAYVVRGEKKIDMTGIIIGDKTFIKIRDFEKLGYRVDYKVAENGAPWAVLGVNY